MMKGARAPSSLTPSWSGTRRALAFVYVAFAFRYIYPLVLVPFLARSLGAEEYGRVLACGAISTFVWVLTEWGFPAAGQRDAATLTERGPLARIYGEYIAGRLLTVGPVACLGLLSALATPILSGKLPYALLAVLTGALCAFNLGWFFQGTMRFKTSIGFEFLGAALSLPLILTLVSAPDDGLLLLAIQAASTLVATLAAHATVIAGVDRTRLRISGALQTFRKSSALFAHLSVGILAQSVVLYEVSLFVEPERVGHFGAAEKLVGLAFGALAPATSVLVSTVQRRWTTNPEDGARFARKVIVATTLLAIFGTLVVELFASPIIRIALGPQYAPATGLVRLLILTVPVTAVAQAIANYVLLPMRRDLAISLTSIAAVAVLFASVPYLTASYELTGACIARVGASALLAVLTFCLVLNSRTLVSPRPIAQGVAPRGNP